MTIVWERPFQTAILIKLWSFIKDVADSRAESGFYEQCNSMPPFWTVIFIKPRNRQNCDWIRDRGLQRHGSAGSFIGRPLVGVVGSNQRRRGRPLFGHRCAALPAGSSLTDFEMEPKHTGLGAPVKVGLAICYDIRFPEMASIAAEAGPAQWPPHPSHQAVSACMLALLAVHLTSGRYRVPGDAVPSCVCNGNR